MEGGSSFTVLMGKETRVTPSLSLQLQDHRLPLSNLDKLLPPIDVCVFMCYNDTKTPTNIKLDMLKDALSRTLVSYYAFSAEIVNDQLSGQPQLLCDNQGVEFVEAYADIELWDLNFHKPDESIRKLVPHKKHRVFAVQATQLRCGSLILACSFDHRVADAYSGNMFFMSWAVTAQSKPISLLPCFDRSLLNPTQTQRHSHGVSLDEWYVPLNSIQTWNGKAEDDDGGLVSRIYYIKAEKIKELQAVANSNTGAGSGSITKLVAFSAFLWKLIANSSEKTEMARLSIVVEGRGRISQGEGEDIRQLMPSYVGNVLAFPCNSLPVENLIESPVEWVANEINKVLKPTCTKQHFQGLLDWIETQTPNQVVPSMYPIGGPTLYVSSGLRYPISKVDFGWGPPAFGSYYFPSWGGEAGYVAPMPSNVVQGDWFVYMLLRKPQLNVIQHLAGDVFCPLTCNYLRKDLPAFGF